MTLHTSTGKFITIVAHVLIWVVFGIAIFFYHPLFSSIDIPLQAIAAQGVTLILLIAAFYLNATILVPRFLLKSHTVYYFLVLIAVVIVIVLINDWVYLSFSSEQPLDQVTQMARPPRLHNTDHLSHLERPTIIITALVLGIGTSITAIQKWQKDRQKREELEKEKVSSELSFLKAQINPHFFFNTMNNIYALTTVDAELAGKAIHQLSRMMRYLLYDTQSGHTMLSKEIAFVKDYISLMQLRLTDAVKLNICTPPNVEDIPLAPMIFLPFVENAFKHGVRATQPSHIDISILQDNKLLDMTVKNSVIKDNSVSLDTSSGIGLVNTKRRLDLLYPGKYTLDINELNADNEYTVHLVLNLS
ncbi:MAG TPA: histidine kinase [Chitinophagaceae bacterium]|nr:histidine kinase [Chitinophagaceae bacterium]